MSPAVTIPGIGTVEYDPAEYRWAQAVAADPTNEGRFRELALYHEVRVVFDARLSEEELAEMRVRYPEPTVDQLGMSP